MRPVSELLGLCSAAQIFDRLFFCLQFVVVFFRGLNVAKVSIRHTYIINLFDQVCCDDDNVLVAFARDKNMQKKNNLVWLADLKKERYII